MLKSSAAAMGAISNETASKAPMSAEDIKIRVEGPSTRESPFLRLPDEIIEQILRICDPNSFASLVLLNSTWRRISQRGYLYAHQLSQCPSYAASHHPIPSELIEKHLPLLRGAFAQEVKRNLFEAYLRPRETVVNLVSTSISSSAAFPGGEAFHFAFSPKGHCVLAYSSSRIYVINTAEKELAVKRELRILRRPASVAILDDASLLAVLSTDHQVDVYDLTEAPPKLARCLALDNAPRTISLAPSGSVLAAAYDAGVEVYSLSINASPTDRRSVKCDAVDSLSFSHDGTQLLGTTLVSKSPSTVILTAPYYDPGDCAPEESVSRLWTTSILFPHSSRDCSHAILLPSPMDDETSWAFTYDRVFETFRAVRIDDLRNGTTYFTGPIPNLDLGSKLLPSTSPTATGAGDLVAAGFQGKEIWLYGVPEDLDSLSDTSQSTINNIGHDAGTLSSVLTRSNSGPSVRSHTWPRDPNSNRTPQWQLLCDKSRNTFIEGRNITNLQGISALKWVSDASHMSCDERLVVVAPGVVGQLFEAEDDGIAPTDGGRFSLLDFEYGATNGGKSIVTIEVGENEPEILEEEHRDMETEVAIVRRRTVAQRGDRPTVLRTVTAAARPGRTVNRVFGAENVVPALTTMRSMPSEARTPLGVTPEQPETASIASVDEAQEALDAPYAHGSPRSGTTLRRAATAAAINRRLHPPRVAQEHIEFRRADGREEHPHESDADNWVPPPPPYSREPVAPLPDHLRNAVPAGSVTAQSQSHLRRSSTQRSSSSTDSNLFNALHRTRTAFIHPAETNREAGLPSSQRAVSDPTSLSIGDHSPENRQEPNLARTTDFDDLYDVSPPDTPEPIPARHEVSTQAIPEIPVTSNISYQIPRRPVASTTSAQFTPPVLTGGNKLQPQSPKPQYTISNSVSGSENRMLQQWEGMIEQPRTVEISRPSTGSSLTQSRLDAPVPLRPNDDHRLTELPPSTPIKAPPSSPPNQNVVPSGNVQYSPMPSAPSETSAQRAGLSEYAGPSASQLARLNSRTGRPPGLSFTDPSRRGSGSFVQPQMAPPNRQNNPLSGAPVVNRYSQVYPQQYPHVFAPPTIPNSSSLPMHPPGVTYAIPNTQPRHRSSGHTRQPSSPRPQMQRLDTIHSITSQGEPAGYVRSTGVIRKTSRAERSAAINIAQAKRRGWGGTVKKKKGRDRDGASSAGWTDMSRDSYDDEVGKKKGKCIVM